MRRPILVLAMAIVFVLAMASSALAGAPANLRVQVEVESEADAEAALEAGAHALLLDNRSPEELRGRLATIDQYRGMIAGLDRELDRADPGPRQPHWPSPADLHRIDRAGDRTPRRQRRQIRHGPPHRADNLDRRSAAVRQW